MFEQLDPHLAEILAFLQQDNHLGILLAAQMGGTPQELQLIIQLTDHLEDQEGQFRVQSQHIVRCIGVVEHKLALGFFARMVHSPSNALLYPYNEKSYRLIYRGQVQGSLDSLMLDLNQLYGQTYGLYEPTRRMVEELNHAAPLATLLSEGAGILGHMPEPFARKAAALLERYGLTTELVELPSENEQDEHHKHLPPIKRQALVLDDSYVVAHFFTADPMGKK
jgi:hypothetical protein